MGFITESLFVDLVALWVSLFIGIIAYLKWNLKYWDRLGVPTLNPTLPFGDTSDMWRKRSSGGELMKKFYYQFKGKGYRHGGLFMGPRPVYMPIDPKIVKHVMQLDFPHFVNHGVYINEESDPLTGNLFNLEDAKWRNMRIKLTPTFTSGKLKMMFQTLADCTGGLRDIIDGFINDKAAVDIKDVLGRFTTDIIGSVAFGLECNSLKDPETAFRIYGKKCFEAVTFKDKLRVLAHIMVPFSFLRFIGFKFNKPDVEKFFMKIVHDTVAYREKNNIYRKDFMHLLIQLKNRGEVTDDGKITNTANKPEGALTMNELAAQAFVFFLAGFETSSTTMTFALYELAVNPEVQAKVREEITTVLAKYDNKITYDAMMELTYMENVIYETLRKYPPVPALNRICTQDYTVPGTQVQIKKGTHVSIPVWGLHTDPEYYPNPDKFDPERFTEENKNTRPPFTWIPFGEGPRLCIGMRFGMLQSKVGMTTLLRNYNIKLSKKTIHPLAFSKTSFITSAEGGIWLDFEKIA